MKKILLSILFLSFCTILFSIPKVSSAAINLDILEIEKLGRNLSNGDILWVSPVIASPGDVLEFKITVKSKSVSRNVMVRDVLPAKIIYQGNLKINGVSNSKNINTEAINVGDLGIGGIAIVTFQARIDSATFFNLGETNLYNPALAYTGDEKTAKTSASLIVVRKKQVAGITTDVPTGITNNFLVDSLIIPLGLTCLLLWIFKSRIVGLDKFLGEKTIKILSYRADKKLEKKIKNLRIRV